MWSWAMRNVSEDNKEQEKLLFSLMDTLTWWLQPEIKQKMAKEEKEQWPDAVNYIKDLRESGASEEYIAKEMAEIEEEREKQRQIDALKNGKVDDEDADTMEIVRGPNG